MNRPTPQEQAENMLAGLKHTYQVVAKRHVHPWYSWALMAAAIGFTVGVAYVANQNAQFDESKAAVQRLSQNVKTSATPISSKESFEIVYPENRSSYSDNPIIIVRSPESVFRADEIEWTATEVNAQGLALKPAQIIKGSYRQGMYIPGYFVYVPENFNDLLPGTYKIQAITRTMPKIFGSITLTKPTGTSLKEDGACTCIDMKVVPLTKKTGDVYSGFKDVPDIDALPWGMLAAARAMQVKLGEASSLISFPFKVEAQISGPAAHCTEYQKIQATISVKSDDGYVEGAPVGRSNMAANNGSQIAELSTAQAKGLTVFPYDENSSGVDSDQGYADDGYADTSLANKWHAKDRIYWYDAPGGPIPDGMTLSYKARFIHTVAECTCKTRINIVGKNGRYQTAEFETDCPGK